MCFLQETSHTPALLAWWAASQARHWPRLSGCTRSRSTCGVVLAPLQTHGANVQQTQHCRTVVEVQKVGRAGRQAGGALLSSSTAFKQCRAGQGSRRWAGWRAGGRGGERAGAQQAASRLPRTVSCCRGCSHRSVTRGEACGQLRANTCPKRTGPLRDPPAATAAQSNWKRGRQQAR